MKVLANDGISQGGIEKLKSAGFEVIITKVAQEQLANFINDNQIAALLVRSATKVRKELIDACPNLKLIGRGGVGMDNIDVDYARSKGLQVINTPEASSASVAELVFAHIFSGTRFLFDSNRQMPLEGDTRFKELKKSYAGAKELRGKTLGIIGFGKIGKEVAKIALGLGMEVIASAKEDGETEVSVEFFNGKQVQIPIKRISMERVLEQADMITLHLPAQKQPVIGASEIEKMKDGVAIINTSRGGVMDEVALIQALESGKVSFAGLDVYVNEPTPAVQVLMNPHVSLSPHIGGATVEAQDRIGEELAEQIIELLK